ncbi:hypothetical protein [Acinetobacter sp. YH12245]|uniref:hypothetical protein n=1 Tax=Acinetobacter sp. YH12245 TaxID=2601171 RepID=UPI0015D4228F|nr:hypothetical protein [Acinetobacter sp. YH12245]
MDIQRKCFEESNNVNPDWSFKFDEELQQYVAIDFEMTNQVDEFNEHWDTFRAGWQAAKAQAVPEGFVLVEKAKIKTWFQDDDEPENFCSEESEIADLADPYETGEIIKINRIEDCVISVTPLYGTWKIDRIDQEGDVHRSFVLCDSYYEAEKVIVSNKEVYDEWLLAQQAQEPAND